MARGCRVRHQPLEGRLGLEGYAIRLARADEPALLPSIEARAARLFHGRYLETGLTDAMLERITAVAAFERARQAERLWVAATSGGEPIGFALMIELGKLAHLHELDVLPDHGRQGVGAQLLDAVCAQARSAGYPAVTLSTFRDIPWNGPFYARHGFRVVDPARLSREHVALVESERAHGLRVDLRVVMERQLIPSER